MVTKAESELPSPEVEVQRAERAEAEPLINVPSLSLALVATTIAIVFMTILAEESSSFKSGLTDLVGHHWIAKGLIGFGVFVVAWLATAVPLARYGENETAVRRAVLAAVGTALAAIVVIFLYYVGHFASK